jgi:hypothetical protein
MESEEERGTEEGAHVMKKTGGVLTFHCCLFKITANGQSDDTCGLSTAHAETETKRAPENERKANEKVSLSFLAYAVFCCLY